MNTEFGSVFEVASSRKVFREALNFKIISRDEFNVCLAMTEDRNRTSHTYNENLAEKICGHIPKYYEVMKAVAERLIK